MPRLQRTFAVCLLIAYAALSSFGAGWVLCTESDGRVALEGLTSGCCGEVDDHAEQSSPEQPAHQDRDCEGCTDVALDQLMRSRHADDETHTPSTAAPICVATATAKVPWLVETRSPAAPRAPPRPPPQHAFLKTTILLL